MRYYHRHSFFPLVIVALSLLLAGFMFLVFRDAPEPSPYKVEEVQEVDSGAYQEQVVELVQMYLDEPSSQSVADCETISQEALVSLLALRVPAQYKDFHLDLAVALNRLTDVCGSEAGDTAFFSELIDRLELEYAWFDVTDSQAL